MSFSELLQYGFFQGLIEDFYLPLLWMNSGFEFKIGSNTFHLQDVNSPLNDFFMKFYESHFANHSLDITQFRHAALRFFDANKNSFIAHDKVFNNFTIIWNQFLGTQQFGQAENIWIFALGIAYEWEAKNTSHRIHKGTPYYFWATTCILNQELEKGFLLMHQALEEDKMTSNAKSPASPAYFFVTLDYSQQNQTSRHRVRRIADFLEKELEVYRSERKFTLTLSDMGSKFLKQTNLEEEVFYLVFTLFRLDSLLNGIDGRLERNLFASLLESNSMFTLCLILDAVIKYKNPTEWKFIDHLAFPSAKSSLTLSKDRLGKINGDFETDFQKTLESLLDSTYKVDGIFL